MTFDGWAVGTIDISPDNYIDLNEAGISNLSFTEEPSLTFYYNDKLVTYKAQIVSS